MGRPFKCPYGNAKKVDVVAFPDLRFLRPFSPFVLGVRLLCPAYDTFTAGSSETVRQ
ncbi:hypothetical protein ES708_16326 [subsurface metagenome]